METIEPKIEDKPFVVGKITHGPLRGSPIKHDPKNGNFFVVHPVVTPSDDCKCDIGVERNFVPDEEYF